ncbi:hypothetical protein QYE76_049794 [Lolium multiflorum]|uniref:Reverse transcriptase RNase H-like domain-containing protein n=1 Tax=Lolium multiflorum TaxID=4521 RepID=A0AAD8SPU1_LOLMU|nr:hypothetical protein QYE76_049794 [Lolium multiflorum]
MNRALTNQAHNRGTSEQRRSFGSDLEKRTWLAKYATPTNLQLNSVSSSDLEKQAWLAMYATPLIFRALTAASTADQISTILRDQFGMVPKRRAIGYSKPYPNDYDLIPLPSKYRLPEFSKFSGSDGSSSIEHVSRYLVQLGTISAADALRVRFFAHLTIALGEQQQAFDEIKRYLTTRLSAPAHDRSPIPSLTRPLLVVQLYEGVEKVVFYLSRRMLDAETRYPEVEKLCLCLFFTCTKLHHILLTAEIIVICKSDVVKHMLSALF